MVVHGVKPRYLLDTNILIYFSRDRPDSIMKRLDKLDAGEAVMSVVAHRRSLTTREQAIAESVARCPGTQSAGTSL